MRYGYLDIGNYYVTEVIDFNLEQNSDSKNLAATPHFLKSNLYFFNTGGTISAEHNELESGLSCVDIQKKDELLSNFLIKNNVNYVCSSLKFSEDYFLEDYFKLKNELNDVVKNCKQKGLKCPSILFTHGTDNIAYFAAWIKLLAIQLDFQAIIMIAQRSHDRPTCELHALLDVAYELLLKLKKKNCYVLTYYDENYLLIHDSFEIKKIHTFRKNAFWSLNQKYVNRKKPFFKSEESYVVVKTRDEKPKDLKLVSISNVLQDGTTKIILGTGLGNTRTRKADSYYKSIVPQGPLSDLVYYKSEKKCDKKLDFFKKLNFSNKEIENLNYESMQTILNLTC